MNLSMEELLAQNHFTVVEIEEIMSNALVVKCAKKTVLLREGEIPRFFYYVTKGIFRGGYTDKKGDDITRVFHSSDTIPFIANYGNFITQTPSFSFIEALEDGEVLALHIDYFRQLEDTNAKWVKFFKKQLDKAIVIYEFKEWRRYVYTPEEQYLAFLDAMPSLVNRISQHYIASYVGVSPQALSRIKNVLSKQSKKK
jgi:CRP/FNR family transcriptional regulator, cyclic AMP receptor protein